MQIAGIAAAASAIHLIALFDSFGMRKMMSAPSAGANVIVVSRSLPNRSVNMKFP